MRRLCRLVSACVVGATALLVAGSAVASSPLTGRIVFSAGSIGPGGPPGTSLWVMNADGSGVRRFAGTNGTGTASWSPDGTRIVFDLEVDAGCHLTACNRLFVVNANGTNLHAITPISYRAENPDWSPDGTTIAFDLWSKTGDSIALALINVDGSGLKRLTRAFGSTQDEDPAWSPDGTKIAFSKTRGGGPYLIYVINSDGTGERRFSRGANADDVFPAWSPDGSKLAFERETSDANSEIVVAAADGSRQRTLPHTADGSDGVPAWSPDGTRIAFAELLNDLGVMQANGQGRRIYKLNRCSQPTAPDWVAATG